MESNKRITSSAVIAIFALVVLGFWLFGGKTSDENKMEGHTEANSESHVAPAFQLTQEEKSDNISLKKTEILERTRNSSPPLTKTEKESIVKYVSGANGAQFNFTLEEKLLIVKAINRN